MDTKKQNTTSKNQKNSVTEVILDVSGSANIDVLKGFLKKLEPLLNSTQLKVGCLDADNFFGFDEIKTADDLNNYEFKSNFTATNLVIGLKSFTKDDKVNKIIFTDGWDVLLDKNTDDSLKNIQNLTWIVSENDEFKAPVGKVIFADNSKFLNQNQTKTQTPTQPAVDDEEEAEK